MSQRLKDGEKYDFPINFQQILNTERIVMLAQVGSAKELIANSVLSHDDQTTILSILSDVEETLS